MSNVNEQIVVSRDPGTPLGTGQIQEELKNQQLNTALAAGTVDEILMKTGYSPYYDFHVVVLKDIKDFCTPDCVNDLIKSFNDFDFGYYNTSTTPTRDLYIQTNITSTSAAKVPNTTECQPRQICIDNYDGSLYLRGKKNAAVVKVNAGTVNGWIIKNTNNSSQTVLDLKDYYTKTEVISKLNAQYTYVSPGTLYIKQSSI